MLGSPASGPHSSSPSRQLRYLLQLLLLLLIHLLPLLLLLLLFKTIGYGSRYPMGHCPDAITLLVIHILWTTFLATLFAGCFLAKFSM